ncbi:hypothetical protein Clacol_001583 [Clathrus columnatus]|uniref:HSF-type DNA-binding domain-containing protein n=1 Tax=Clathrus columnatus TaxID=1419009 RepID=A0AAV4ZYK1_9AGAM|nr:hypothetical protein Clacol_001583 [Clathrus columnatus]
MDPQRSHYYPHQQYTNNIVYPQLLSNPQPDNTHLPLPHDRESPQKQHQADSPPKSESKPQATFLTKLYALLERPENHHMIRWDAAGDHIIVEKPEQLALHVLPSIYRQSRFASFSRQLNIYGFMRKVNLRNVDPAIDDPDASTWSHPTLNRHSPPEVVANFKRRVPPRLPKTRKRPDDMSLVAPRSAVGLNPVSLTVPSSMPAIRGRARGFSAPGAFVSSQVGPHWNGQYNRTPLPPLTVPSDTGTAALAPYGHPSTHLASPTDDSSSHSSYASTYNNAVREPSGGLYLGSSAYSNPPPSQSTSSWEFPPLNASAVTSTTHSGPTLSSLLNHPSSNNNIGGGGGGGNNGGNNNGTGNGGYGSRLSISTSQVQPFNSLSMPSSSSLSPDSRPTTGYSGTSSMSSLPYEPHSPSDPNGRDYDHSHAHHSVQHHHHHHHHPDSRPLTPGGSLSRPHSANKGGNGTPYAGSNGNTGSNGLPGMRRGRRHSQAVSPYPSPYEPDTRPLSAPDASNLPRTKSLMTLSMPDSNYYLPPAQAEFAYSPTPTGHDHHNHHHPGVHGTNAMDTTGSNGPWNGTTSRIRPSTSQSSLSAASHSSSSAANTPPTLDSSYSDTTTTDMHRFSSSGSSSEAVSPEFRWLAMSDGEDHQHHQPPPHHEPSILLPPLPSSTPLHLSSLQPLATMSIDSASPTPTTTTTNATNAHVFYKSDGVCV